MITLMFFRGIRKVFNFFRMFWFCREHFAVVYLIRNLIFTFYNFPYLTHKNDMSILQSPRCLVRILLMSLLRILSPEKGNYIWFRINEATHLKIWFDLSFWSKETLADFKFGAIYCHSPRIRRLYLIWLYYHNNTKYV